MARSSTVDPVEKFRFKLTVFSIDLSVSGAIETIAAAIGANPLAVISRAGFSEMDVPRANVNEILYRENIDAQRYLKIPGLVKYDPITLKRGVTSSTDLYDWYRLVNEDTLFLASSQEVAQGTKMPPTQNARFRKDLIIEVIDRTGTTVKAWQLFNAFPISYRGGDGLDAASEAKLVEELTLTYEAFVELTGTSAADLGEQLLKGALMSGVNTVIDSFSNGQNPFTS